MLEALSSAALLPLILATLCAAAGGLVAARRAERLRARVTAFIFLACLPVPLLFAAAMYRTTLVEAEYAKSDALRMAKLIGGQQAAVLDSVRGLLEVVGRSVRIRGELATCEAYLEEIRQHNPIITAINRVEPDGRIACSSRHASSGADVSDLGYIRQAAESGALTLSGYRMGIVTGRPLIGMALPVRGGDGRTDFLVVAGIGLDGLGVSLAETDLPAGTETVLVDAEGRLLAARPATAGPLGGTVPWAAQARRDIAGAGVSAIGPERRLVAAAPFGPGGSGASVMVALPPDFADRTLNRLLRDAGLAVAAGMAVMLLAAWFVSQHLVVRWIGAMAAAAGAVGRGDLGRRVGPPYERGELGELARAFDGMAGALQRRERAAVAAAAELRASEERFRDLIEGSLQGVCIHRDFVPVFVNQAYASILGFDSVDAVFRLGSILSTIPDRHRAEAWSRNAALLDGGGYTGRVRVQNIRPDGRALWLDIIDRVVQWEGAPAVQVTLMDVTDHVLREQELERSRGRLEAQAADLARLAEEQGRLRLEAERLRGEAEAASAAKSQFLAVMSHELRTPLNAVIGFSGMIEGQVHGPADPRYTEYATLIREGGEHLLALINDLLDFSKADAGRLGLVIEPLDVARTVDAAVRLVGPQIAARGHRLHLDLPPRAVVAADERRVKQILVNLLSNAMKYTPDGGDIGVSAAVQGRWLLLTVTDTGVGIAEADQERVLQPFQQVDNQLTRGGEGTGLGLPLAKRLAELHGGSLRLFSRLGTGTAVTVALPLQPAAAGGPEVAASLAG